MKKSIFYWLTLPFTYWYNFFIEFTVWFKFQRLTKQNRLELEKDELRVDWIGRVYGVVNIPDEVLGAAEQIQQSYVLKEMGRFGKSLQNLGVADEVYPQMQEITGAGAYLVVFWPVVDRLNILLMLGNTLYTFIYGFLFYLVIRWFIFYNIFGKIADSISSIL
ncbi:MAG: hypothetical protein CMP57_03930 [Flavobacteriales bacterium]|nr:hypothetical protein [Flavobacteriales bacterium]